MTHSNHEKSKRSGDSSNTKTKYKCCEIGRIPRSHYTGTLSIYRLEKSKRREN